MVINEIKLYFISNSTLQFHRKMKNSDRWSYPSEFKFIFPYRQASSFGFLPRNNVLVRPTTLMLWE